MTNTRKLLYLTAVILLALDIVFLKFWGLWVIMIVCADPGFHSNWWNVVLAILTAIFFALGLIGVLPDGAKIAVLFAIACLAVALANRFHQRQSRQRV